MELQVFVDGKSRDVCGVDERTTTEEITSVLMETLKLCGSYCLVAYWRENEIILSPNECPLNLIRRFGGHPDQFQFILRQKLQQPAPLAARARSPVPSINSHRRPPHSYLQNSTTSYVKSQEPYPRIPGGNDAAALEQKTDWNKLYQKEYQTHNKFLTEREEHRVNLQRLEIEIGQKRNEMRLLESERTHQLATLWNLVENAVKARETEVSILMMSSENDVAEANHPGPAPSYSSNNLPISRATPIVDGVMI